MLLIPGVNPDIDDLNETTITISIMLSKLPIGIRCRKKVDDISEQTGKVQELTVSYAIFSHFPDISYANGFLMNTTEFAENSDLLGNGICVIWLLKLNECY